jgi:hypothetical protein
MDEKNITLHEGIISLLLNFHSIVFFGFSLRDFIKCEEECYPWEAWDFLIISVSLAIIAVIVGYRGEKKFVKYARECVIFGQVLIALIITLLLFYFVAFRIT